jgi:hypothetical protein
LETLIVFKELLRTSSMQSMLPSANTDESIFRITEQNQPLMIVTLIKG